MNKTLNDIVKIKGRIGWRGYTVEDLRDSGPMVIGANDITTDNKLTLKNVKHISREKFEESPEIMIEKNDILVVKVGSTIGKVAIVDFDIGEACINPNTVLLKNCKEDPIYLYYYLKSNFGQKFLLNNSLASAQSALSQTTLKKLPIYFPEIKEQKKVVRIIRNIDKKIDINDKINSELEKIAKTIYNYWFVQFDFPDENGKPYKSSGGEMVLNKELKRKIPKDWEVKRLKDILPVITGKKDANFASTNGQYNFFTCGEEILKCDSYEFEGKAVLVAGNGNFNIKLYDGKFNAYQRTYILIPSEKKHYTLVYMAVRDRIAYLIKGSRGSIVKFITKGDLEDIQIALPKDQGLDVFSQLNTITKKIEKNLEENQKLAELRDFLLPMLMNGQVTIR